MEAEASSLAFQLGTAKTYLSPSFRKRSRPCGVADHHNSRLFQPFCGLGELLGEKAMPAVWLDGEVAEDVSDEFC
jgi:hypothetical protein